jgi:predicted PurR-regulated permease PerM
VESKDNASGGYRRKTVGIFEKRKRKIKEYKERSIHYWYLKLKHNGEMNQSKETRSTVYWQILGLISVALLAYMFFSFIDVIIYGIFIYYVARPMYREFDRRFKHKSAGAFLSLFIVVLPIVLISIYTVGIAYIELTNFLTQVDSGYIDYVNELFKDYGGIAQYMKPDDIPSLIGQGGSWGSIIALLTRFSGIFSTFFGIFFNLFLTFAIAFYLLKDGTNLREWFTNTFPGGKTELTTMFFDAVDSDLHTVFLGNILTAILTALIGAITFSLLNLVAPPQLLIPYPIVLAILCGLGIFIPLIGMKVIWIPLAIYLVIQAYLNGILFTNWWFLLLFLIAVSVVVDFVPDTILRPYISRKQIHAGAMLFAYIFGIAAFGFVGLFLGPMILILATQFMKIVQPALLDQRSAPT